MIHAVIKYNLSQTLNVLNKIFFILITYKRNSINIICIEKKKDNCFEYVH